jgi:hypothetical protein
MLNISRIISKLSLDNNCSKEILITKNLTFLIDIMTQFKEFTPFVIRIAFVLGNLTTYYDEAREELGGKSEGIKKCFSVL